MVKLCTLFKSGSLKLFSFFILLLCSVQLNAQQFASIATVNNVSTTGSAVTGEKPQSKVWFHESKWWAVFPSSNTGNTHLWRLDGNSWTQVLQLTNGIAYADCKLVGNVTHVLLYKGTSSQLVSLEYASNTYDYWTNRPSAVNLGLNSGVETATIDIDVSGRMFLAYAGTSSIFVQWSDAPYSSWSSAVTLATGVNDDDIAAVISMPGKIGVLWSNQNTERFGFRTISNGADPSVISNWSVDEMPASQSALNVGSGMSDDHINMKVSNDGTLYAAVKTSYDGGSNPSIALLVRRTDNTWDNLHQVTSGNVGTRPIVIINETLETVKVIYTAVDGGGNIYYKESPAASIVFGAQQTLISGNYNNVSSSKQNYDSAIVILASSGSQVVSVLAVDEEVVDPVPAGALVGHWQMDEVGGSTLTDASSYANNGTTVASPSRVAGKIGQALQLNGSSQYATVKDSNSLDIESQITLAAWIKPDKQGTQYVIKKARQSNTDGYELSLANGGNVFFRFNQATNGDAFRVNSTSTYPIDGNTWIHIAGTFDGTSLKIYINGVLEATTTPVSPEPIATNSLDLVLGADGSDFSDKLDGALDDARVYNIALTAEQIMELTMVSPPATPVQVSPANTATNIPLSTLLSWNVAPAASTYRLQVSTSEDFSALIYDDAGITETSASLSELLTNTTYYWRLNATNSFGSSSWSETFQFTTVSAPIVVVDNGAGYALDFDGINDHVIVPDNNIFDIATNLTIEAWIKPEKTATQRIVSKSTQNSVNGYELSISSGGIPFIRFNQSSTLDVNRVNATTVLQQGTWYHIAATYDGTTIRLYINGREEGNKASAITIDANSRPLAFGIQPGAANTYPFEGAIDEVRIWNIARTDEEIKQNMSRKLAGTETGLAGYWRFDEIAGIVVLDATSNANNGTLESMTEADHVWSGAAIGDISDFDYTATGGYTASLTHADGDVITATVTNGTITGIQIYQSDDTPLRDEAVIPADLIVVNNRFSGIKVLGTGALDYTLVYDFSGVPSLTAHASTLRLLRRTNLSDNSWEDATATLDAVNFTLTITGASNMEYALASTDTELPVMLTSFNAKAHDKNVLINWETETEINNQGFYVEHSVDGIHFLSLTFIPSRAIDGNSSAKLIYSYSDFNYIAGVNYYRLKQVDRDGAITYSKIVIVKMTAFSARIHSYYPNPVQDQLQLMINSGIGSDVSVRIRGLSGAMVKHLPGNIAAGVNQLKMNLSSLSPGLYVAEVMILKTGELLTFTFIKN